MSVLRCDRENVLGDIEKKRKRVRDNEKAERVRIGRVTTEYSNMYVVL